MPFPRLVEETRFVVVDLETTGLSRNTAQPVQIAFTHVDHGRPGLRGHYLVQPTCPIQEGARRVHGIDATTVEYAPRFEHIAAELAGLLAGRVWLGFNIERFDVPILTRMLAGAGLPTEPEILDLFWWARRLLPGRKKYKLSILAEDFHLQQGRAHDAWHDCRTAWQLFTHFVMAQPHFGAMSFADVKRARNADNRTDAAGENVAVEVEAEAEVEAAVAADAEIETPEYEVEREPISAVNTA